MTRARFGALRLPARSQAILVLCAVAVGAALGGAAVDRMMHRPSAPGIALPDTTYHPISSILRSPSEADRRAIRAELTRQLQLTPQQADTIDSIMNRRAGQFRALRAEIRPRVQQLVDDVHASIDQVLTPAQRERFRRLKSTSDSGSGK